MATLKITAPAEWTVSNDRSERKSVSLISKYNQFADSQAKNHTGWFWVSLLVYGVLFLPLPAVLIYYFNAPVIVLAITMTSFFTTLIANMGGAGIRTTILVSAAGALIHIAMLLAFIV
jgi:hypothetical protein